MPNAMNAEDISCSKLLAAHPLTCKEKKDNNNNKRKNKKQEKNGKKREEENTQGGRGRGTQEDQTVSETRRQDKNENYTKQKEDDNIQPTSRAATTPGSECTYRCTSKSVAAWAIVYHLPTTLFVTYDTLYLVE